MALAAFLLIGALVFIYVLSKDKDRGDRAFQALKLLLSVLPYVRLPSAPPSDPAKRIDDG